MLAAVLTVSGPWLEARWRRWWWTLLLAFVPIHLVVSAVVPARSLLGLAVGWFVGALVVLVVGTPALEVPLDGAVRALVRRGFLVTGATVVRPPGPGPLVLSARRASPRRTGRSSSCTARTSAAAASCASSGAELRLRDSETAPLHASMRRAVEHRGLMAIAIGDLGRGQHLDGRPGRAGPRLDAVRAHARGALLDALRRRAPCDGVAGAAAYCTSTRSPTATCAPRRSPSTTPRVLFGGFGCAEYGATDAQLQADIAQLLMSTTALFGAEPRSGAAIADFDEDTS